VIVFPLSRPTPIFIILVYNGHQCGGVDYHQEKYSQKEPVTQLDLQTLPLSGLRHHCAQESDRFFHRQEHDPRFCYELFRRAMLERDEDAWAGIYQQYQRLALHWVQQHPTFYVSGEEAQFFLNRAFEKMWLGITPDKFPTFTDLKALLRYLQMCVHSVMIDFARQKESRLVLEAVEEAGRQLAVRGTASGTIRNTAVEDKIASHLDRQALWQWLQEQCKDEKEVAILEGMFVLGLKPREVQDNYPRLFGSVNDVYRVKENLLARLRRSEKIADFWDYA
jgi:hypothetical protein